MDSNQEFAVFEVVRIMPFKTFFCAQAGSSGLPNIVFIFPDDHATQVISAYESYRNETSNIDRLAKRGGKYSHAFATNSIFASGRIESLFTFILTGSGLLFVSRIGYQTLVIYIGAVPEKYYSLQKRPAYREYQKMTNMFFSGPVKKGKSR